MNIIEIIIVLFALFAFSRAVLRLKDKAISIREFIFWTIVWISLITLTLLRKQLGFIGELSGLGDPFKIIVMISIVLLFYLMFRLYVKLDRTEQQITKCVREISIKKVKK